MRSLVLFAVTIAYVGAIVCPPDGCEGVSCPTILQCTTEGHELQLVGCGCCRTCNKVLAEGESCVQASLLPPPISCASGLVCLEGICVKESAVIKDIKQR